MIFILALLAHAAGLAAVPMSVVIDRSVTINPSDFKSLTFAVKNRPATVEIDFTVSPKTGRVRLIVLPMVEENRFRAGRAVTEVASTEFESEGALKAHLKVPGDYTIIVDHRQERDHKASVRIRGTLTSDPAPVVAKTLSVERRIVVISTSLGVFLCVSIVAGRKLWATVSRTRLEPPPPYA